MLNSPINNVSANTINSSSMTDSPDEINGDMGKIDLGGISDNINPVADVSTDIFAEALAAALNPIAEATAAATAATSDPTTTTDPLKLLKLQKNMQEISTGVSVASKALGLCGKGLNELLHTQ